MDNGLKQRIIGAIVLVIAAVVFLPMLLSGQDETVRVQIDAPEPPELDPTPIARAAPVELSEPQQLPDIPPSIPTPDPIDPPRPSEPDVPPQPAVATAAPVAPAVAPPPAPAAPAVPAAPAPAAPQGDWVVQLGSFSSVDNASGLAEKLRTQGYNAYTVPSQVDGKSITRVFVGPVVDREGANRLRDELARRSGSKGLVVAYDASTRAR